MHDQKPTGGPLPVSPLSLSLTSILPRLIEHASIGVHLEEEDFTTAFLDTEIGGGKACPIQTHEYTGGEIPVCDRT